MPRIPDARNQLFYLPRVDAIVIPQMRQAGGWRCTVVAVQFPWRPAQPPGYLDVADDELAGAPTSLTIDRDSDPDRYAMLWVARVYEFDPGGILAHLARRVAEDLRQPGSRTVDLGPASFAWLRRNANRVVLFTLRLHLARLVGEGFLARETTGGAAEAGTYLMTLPHDRRWCRGEQ